MYDIKNSRYGPESSFPYFSSDLDITTAIESRQIFKAKPSLLKDDTLFFELGSYTGVLAKEDLDLDPLYRPRYRLQKDTCFLIQYQDGNTLYLSRISCQLLSKKEWENIKPSDVITAEVINFCESGLLADIGCGRISFLPTRFMANARIKDPRTLFSIGETFPAVVFRIYEKNRITLSHKELLGSWIQNYQKVKNKVITTGHVGEFFSDDACFVDITPNLSGLMELPKDVSLNFGDTIEVLILKISYYNGKTRIVFRKILPDIKMDKKYFPFNVVQSNGESTWFYTPTHFQKEKKTIFYSQ